MTDSYYFVGEIREYFSSVLRAYPPCHAFVSAVTVSAILSVCSDGVGTCPVLYVGVDGCTDACLCVQVYVCLFSMCSVPQHK